MLLAGIFRTQLYCLSQAKCVKVTMLNSQIVDLPKVPLFKLQVHIFFNLNNYLINICFANPTYLVDLTTL